MLKTRFLAILAVMFLLMTLGAAVTASPSKVMRQLWRHKTITGSAKFCCANSGALRIAMMAAR